MKLKNKVFFDADISLNPILNKKIGIIGYGNQGRAQALNLRDSGIEVIVSLRDNSPTIQKVMDDKMKCRRISDIIKESDILSLMMPDDFIDDFINKNLKEFKKNQTLLVSHGSGIIYGKTKIPKYLNIIMVAPSGGGKIVRNEYKRGFGVPALVAIENDFSGNMKEIALAYAKAIGSSRAAVFLSTFKEETETDLFGEQVILTGSIPMIIIESYKILLEEGYDPIVSWFVCFYELKTIVNLMFEKGMTSFYDMVSNTARYGGITRGKMLIDDSFKEKMRKILNDIKNGSFNKELKEALSKNDTISEKVFNSNSFNEVEREVLKKIKDFNS